MRAGSTALLTWLLLGLASALLSPLALAEMATAATSATDRPSSLGPRVAIIIDDLGHALARDQQALSLPSAVAMAVLPHTPFGETLAEQAHQQGHEVLLHMPMQSADGRASEVEFLTSEMSRRQLQLCFAKALADVPHVVGVNNHQGSLLTSHRQPMSWVMDVLRQRQLYFIDSRTTEQSLALDEAQQHQVPTTARTVFLDNDRSPAAIAAALDELLRRAHRDGSAVAIGHPYPETTTALLSLLPTLEAKGVVLVPPSALVE